MAWIRIGLIGFLFLKGLSCHGMVVNIPTMPTMIQWEDSLRALGTRMYQGTSESERLQANFDFVRTLVSALKTPYSFDFKFDSLETISILTAPDGRFRVFSWHIALSDGSYLYYGSLQFPSEDGTLRLIPLLDKTYEIREPDGALTDTNQWYGAQYYDIVPLGESYLLLGWKGHTPRVTQRVIEVLTLDPNDGPPQLGNHLFDAPGYHSHARIIFRHKARISMHLAYEPEARRILFDHLVPAEPRLKGQFEHYGPDLTFDAWQLDNKKLLLVEEAEYQEYTH